MSPSSLDEDRCRLSITRLVAVTVPRGVVDHIVLVITQGPPLLEPAGVGVVLARQQVGIRGLGSVERWRAHFPSPSLVRYPSLLQDGGCCYGGRVDRQAAPQLAGAGVRQRCTYAVGLLLLLSIKLNHE